MCKIFRIFNLTIKGEVQLSKKSKVLLGIGVGIVALIVIGLIAFFNNSSKESIENDSIKALEIIHAANEKFSENQGFNFKFNTYQQNETDQGEILAGGPVQKFDFKVAKDQVVKVEFVEGQKEADNEEFTVIDGANFYLTSKESYVDDTVLSFKESYIRKHIYSVPSLLNQAEQLLEEFNIGQQAAKTVTVKKADDKFTVTYKETSESETDSYTEYSFVVDASSNEIKTIQYVNLGNGKKYSEEYKVNTKDVKDTISVPKKGVELITK